MLLFTQNVVAPPTIPCLASPILMQLPTVSESCKYKIQILCIAALMLIQFALTYAHVCFLLAIAVLWHQMSNNFDETRLSNHVVLLRRWNANKNQHMFTSTPQAFLEPDGKKPKQSDVGSASEPQKCL
eukprot:m.264039 g.264039  ORF g.264039 m.264039 type:complete len:128 (+) comp15609_c1_seq3:1842-2225(+)